MLLASSILIGACSSSEGNGSQYVTVPHAEDFSDGTVLLQSETKNEVIYSSKENQLELLEALEDELEAGVIQ